MNNRRLPRIRIRDWGEYASQSRSVTIPQHPGGLAHRFDRIGLLVMVYCLILLVCLRLGVNLFWSITASFAVIGLYKRCTKSSRAGLISWIPLRYNKEGAQPAVLSLNRRIRSMIGVGVLLLFVSGCGAAWNWYYGLLGLINIIMAFYLFRFRLVLQRQT